MSCKERLPTEKITSAKCNLLVLSLKDNATAMNLGQGPLESTVFVLLHHKDVRVAPLSHMQPLCSAITHYVIVFFKTQLKEIF